MARILVVDDDAAFLKLVQNLLTANGHQTLLARSGSQALELCASERPDLILLDVKMPQMDGFETCRRLKANNATAPVPVIMMTISDDPRLNKEAFTAGATFTLAKPFPAQRLVNILRLALAPGQRREG